MVRDEFEMENQGYEEEHSTRSPLDRRHSVQPSPALVDNPRSPPIVQGIRAIVVHPLRADQEAHVYEDIGVSSLDDSNSIDQPLCLPRNSAINNNNNNLCNESLRWSENGQKENRDVRIVPAIDGAMGSLSPNESEDASNFHRNLTLPLRRPIGTADDGGIASRYSVRVTNRERSRCFASENDTSLCESSVGSTRMGDEFSKAMSLAIDKPGRRRRKKDCKHCKSKVNGIREHLSDHSVEHSSRRDDSFPVDGSGRVRASGNNEIIERDEKGRLGLEPIFALTDGRNSNFEAHRAAARGTPLSDEKSRSIFSISNNANGFSSAKGPKIINYDKNDTDVRIVPVELMDDRALITPEKNRAGMKVNSIYSQDHWHSKDIPIFVTDVKEQSPFQRAYSLPTRTQTPSSQNRVNLRRSVRGEPPPHPARLRKNRHGWTLHFARPLDGTGCTRSIVLLLIAILALLGIGGIALYIVFEPEKLQIIQQYLRSSTTNISTDSNVTLERGTTGFETVETTELPMASVFLTDIPEAFTRETAFTPETETDLAPTTSEIAPDLNATRHCDDCYEAEVCVALVDEEVPFCRNGPDPLDPTGCAGLCIINKQKCHRLDVDAFRCVEVEHYCLDDEWTCTNTLCIPLIKHCDGHMNCYDHSDEYDCVCDLQTHFQCGNETSCLPLERRCDGKIDCWDATDEINCTLACPSSSEFTCSNGECILRARFCDGLRDCTDGSDEPHGCQGRCNKHEYSCLNGRCITKGMKCNGIDDCGDNSDEQHCRDRIFKKPS